MKLLITESPSKAKTIQKFVNEEFVNDNFVVISSKGHIYQLQKSGKLNLGIDLNTFDPKWEIEKKQKTTVKKIISLAKKASTIYYATDADREGETIAWTLHLEISSKLKKKVKFYRIIFNEITKPAIINAINNPTNFSQPMINSQLTRRMLDRIIGFRLSRLLSIKINSRSAGRVQSIVLKMIVDRFKERQKFIKEKHWFLSLLLEHNFEVNFIGYKNNKEKVFNSLKELKKVKESLKNEVYLTDIISSSRKELPPQPFITATMLRASINNFGYSINKTNFILQTLYEGIEIDKNTVGLITYPRTDSKRISEDFQKIVKSKIIKEFGHEYLGNSSFNKQLKTKNIQDAHEAIRVTDINITPEAIKEYLSDEQFNIYKLIYNATLKVFIKPSIYNVYEFIFNNNDYLFAKQIRINLFPGFKIIDEINKINENNTKNNNLINYFQPNKFYKVIDVQAKEEETKPPRFLTESSIIDQLEKLGIGRPSTYNDAIFKTKQSNYIIKKKSYFIPSYRGLLTEEQIEKYFSEFINYKFSSYLEEVLDEIEQNKTNYKDFLETFFQNFEKKIQSCFKTMEYVSSIFLNIPCPSCKTGKLLIKSGKFGDFIACSNYPECKYISKEKKLLFPQFEEK